MKYRIKLISFVLAVVMVLGLLPATLVSSMDYVIPITTAEEFLAIMDAPDRSYRLENNIDLGTITPLGYQPGQNTVTAFTGALDGNGYTVSYTMNPVAEMPLYGLFAKLDGVNISNLNVNGKIHADISVRKAHSVAIVAGSAYNSTIGGGTISGEIKVTGTTGRVYVSTVVENTDSTTISHVQIKADTQMDLGGNLYGYYYGIGTAINEHCWVEGSVQFSGDVRGIYVITNGNNCHATLPITLHANGYQPSVIAISGGTNNYYSGNIEVYSNDTPPIR